MTVGPKVQNAGMGPLRNTKSIRSRLLTLAMALTLVPLIVFISAAVAASNNVIGQAQDVTAASLRKQAESYLVQINDSTAGQSALILDRAARDVQSVADAASAIYSDKEKLPGTSVAMKVGPERQLMNSATDISSLFVPNTTWTATDYDPALYEAVTRDIELSRYLDLSLPSIQENNPNAAAVYLGTSHNVLHYFPNVRLGEVVPADFSVTQRPWYLSGLENNQDKETPLPVWSEVYYDATGLGLVTTVAVPVYTNAGELVGVAGLDVTLTELQRHIESSRFLQTGYSFLIDESGNAIILPELGHQDLLGAAADPEQPTPNLIAGTNHPVLKDVLEKMAAGERGFTTLDLGGRELYISYSPVHSSTGETITPGWSLASVVAVDEVLADAAFLQTQLRQTIRGVLVTRVLPVGALISLAMIVVAWLVTHRLVEPILRLAVSAQQLGAGDWESPAPTLSEVEAANNDEIGLLAGTLRTMAGQLRQTFGQLEERVAERTQALEQRTLQMQTAAEVARDITLAQDLDSLLHGAANLISERFGYYNVGIFLVDETSEWAYLKAASGELGVQLLEREVRLRVGQQGMVGYVTRFGQAHRSDNVALEAVYISEPLLADTRSELTLPLRSGLKIIGALDVQSTNLQAFSDDDITVLQTLTDQLATAIENVRLVSRIQATLEETSLMFQQQGRQVWSRMMEQTGALGYEYDRLEVKPMTGERSPKALRVPVRLRDQVIGFIGLESEDPNHEWTQDEMAIVEATANQAALTVENARLLAESRRQAAREQITTEVTARLRSSLDMQTVLQSAVREIAQQLSIAEVEVELMPSMQAAEDVTTEQILLDTPDCEQHPAGTNGSAAGEAFISGENGADGNPDGLAMRKLPSSGRNHNGTP